MLFWGRAIFCVMLTVAVYGGSSRNGLARITSPIHAAASAFIHGPIGIPCLRPKTSTVGSVRAFACAQQPTEKTFVGIKTQRNKKAPPLISAEKKARLAEQNRQQVVANEVQLRLGMHGVFAVDKPQGWTSFDVVAKVRGSMQNYLREQVEEYMSEKQLSKPKKNNWRVKVGHGGTLDPMATGVLVVGVGSATKYIEKFITGRKAYDAVGLFGFETDTEDAEGVQVGDATSFDHVTEEALKKILVEKFTGEISQIPPAYSAIKQNGKKSYELARQGIEVEMKPRELTIYSIELTRPLVETFPHFHISVDCGKGTYIRSLVRDIARELGSKAHLAALRRTRQGDFALEDCMSPELMGNAKHIIGLLEDASDQVHLEADMAEDGEDKKA